MSYIGDKEKKVSVNSRNEAKIYRELLQLLEKPRRSAEIDPVITQFGLDKNLSESGKRRLKNKVFDEGLNQIKLKWKSGSSPSRAHLYSSLPDKDINAFEVAIAFHPNSYLCYQTALFWNELTEQVPQTFFIAQERPKTSPKSKAAESFDDFELRDAFVKLPIGHPNVAIFGNYRYIILARAYTGNAGVKAKKISFKGKKVTIPITGTERTLLDCISVPENAGGISNVVDAIKLGAKNIDLKIFYDLYRKLEFKYPHWQRVGLLFEKLGYSELAKEWRSQFGVPRNKFFLAKGYKLEWDFDESWSIYSPPGLFK